MHAHATQTATTSAKLPDVDGGGGGAGCVCVQGERTLLLITKGFRDALQIAYQVLLQHTIQALVNTAS